MQRLRVRPHNHLGPLTDGPTHLSPLCFPAAAQINLIAGIHQSLCVNYSPHDSRLSCSGAFYLFVDECAGLFVCSLPPLAVFPSFKSVALPSLTPPPLPAPHFPPAKFSQSDKHLKGSSSIIKAQWIYNRRQRSSHLRPPGRSGRRQTEGWNDRELVGIEPCSRVYRVCREMGERSGEHPAVPCDPAL